MNARALGGVLGYVPPADDDQLGGLTMADRMPDAGDSIPVATEGPAPAPAPVVDEEAAFARFMAAHFGMPQG